MDMTYSQTIVSSFLCKSRDLKNSTEKQANQNITPTVGITTPQHPINPPLF